MSVKCSSFLSITEILIGKVGVTISILGIVIYLMIATQDLPLPECNGFFYVRPQDPASLSDHTCFHMRQESDEGRNYYPSK